VKRRSFLTALAAAAVPAAETPRFSFAVMTDIQFADQPANLKRDYRGSWERLSRAVTEINRARPAFAIQLGDLVDAGRNSLSRILPVYRSLSMPQYHVLGNHDFCNPRPRLLEQLGMRSAWYDFTYNGWRFVTLDGMDISLPGRTEGTPERVAAEAMLAELKRRQAPNAQDWNGAIGEAQRRWLREVLDDAAQQKQRAIVFCHFPVLRESSTPQHLLWNSDEILRILEASPALAAYMNGHDHNGGYAQRHGIHFVTFPGMVESAVRNSYTLVEVYADRLELRGSGTAPSRTLRLEVRS
jgi:manganese-dependent ADP-ribose/CDP-alcohol diphosphatase